jgi:hypothetical protein
MLNGENSDKVAILCGGVAFLNSSVTLTVGQWTHLAAVRRAGEWRLYVNGVNTAVTSSTTTPNAPRGTTQVGENFNGSIDDVRIYGRPVELGEIQRMASLIGGLKGEWDMNYTARDSSNLNNNLTVHGGWSYSTSRKEGRTSALLNGSDAYANTASVVTTARNNLTMSAWVNWNGGTGHQFIVYNGGSGTSGYGIMLNGSRSGKLSILCGGVVFIDTDTTLPVGQWTHVAAVRRTGTWELYVNGTSVPFVAGANTTATPNRPSGVTNVGGEGGGAPFNGYIDGVRLYEVALSAAQIGSQVSLSSGVTVDDYKAGFHLNGLGQDDSGYSYLMTPVGGASFDYSDSTEGTAALRMPWYIAASSSTPSPVTTVTSNLTLSAWVKWDGGNRNQIIVYNGHSGYDGYGIMLTPGTASNVIILVGGRAFLNTSATLVRGKWTHLAATKAAGANGVWTLYVDGNPYPVLNDSTLTPNTPQAAGTMVGAGFNGLIDNVRVYETALSTSGVQALMALR